ncbi:hypothetical protein IMG5_139690 [Ichthyophthirius multifiliis]|uniref:ABC transporter family protein n=1 Tax=Ichthyophthirius multifiliis TaxID=5932 RepID=G0QX94_ICHMU|nr:hypothetical protein IMG5_139690 [Ichthyophthirius multifiliis]EGR30166.1 hypothetical protein IMG5_139690 [Ichthyophthirius multifiliis]|eukprot:XP_004031402.1 hypothetical protein IMG5_139690 [Ichthyophthirius multifiliis]
MQSIILRKRYFNKLYDIFSSLDIHVSEQVYQNAILKFLLQTLKKTVIIVFSSQYSLFQQCEKSLIDQIFYIQNGFVSKNINQMDIFIEQQQNIVKEEKKICFFDEKKSEQNSQSAIQQLYSNSSSYNRAFSSLKEIKEQAKDEFLNSQQQFDENMDEQRVQGGIKIRTFITYLSSLSFLGSFIYLVLNFATQASIQLIDFWLSDWVDQRSDFYGKINAYFANDFVQIFLFWLILNISITASRGIIYIICNLLCSYRLFNKLNKCIMYSNIQFFDNNPSGRIINRISDDIVNVDDLLPTSVNIFTKLFALSIGYPIGISIKFPWVISLIVVSIFAMYYLRQQFKAANRELKRLSQVNGGKLLTCMHEMHKGVHIIRSFGKQLYSVKSYLEVLDFNINSFLISQAVYTWMLARLQIIVNFLFAFVCISSIVVVYIGNIQKDNYTTISLCITYTILLAGRFSDLLFQYCMFEQQIISVERIQQYFSNEMENLNQKKTNLYKSPASVLFEQQQQVILKNNQIQNDSAILFSNVFLNYEDCGENYALKNFNLNIKKGEKIAICGRTGSGKTSFLNALFNMYPIQQGNIFVNGVDIDELTLKQLRNQISVIPQFGFLYQANLLQNLDPEGKYTDQFILNKIKESKLSLKNQDYQDFQILQGGQNISCGEKQIINFLRIILKNTNIICLDEATSNTDPITDSQINEQLFAFAENKTLIVITHRLENIEKYDRVVVLSQGQIVECGNVQELKQIQNGFSNQLLNKEGDK